MTQTLEELLGRARCILLDFDGPVCSIFAGWPAPDVAETVREQLLDEGLSLGERGMRATDPLDVLRDAAACSREGGLRAEQLLAAAELTCVETAAPTPGGDAFLRAAACRAVPVAIVSNNSGPAVQTYLDRHELTATVTHMSTRDPSDPRLMKPSPHLLIAALAALGQAAEAALMVGDTVGDVAAAHSIGMQVVAYANRDQKIRSLSEAGADHLVTSMTRLVLALTEASGPPRG